LYSFQEEAAVETLSISSVVILIMKWQIWNVLIIWLYGQKLIDVLLEITAV